MQQTDTHTPTTVRNGPGGQLKKARLELKLAPEDVAQILHLSPKQIIALENDDYASLAGPTYVRGYLRGYAQLLGLSPETVIDSYHSLPAATPQVDLTKLTPEPQINSDHHLIRLATYGVFALVFGLAVVWWLGRDDTSGHPKPVVIGQAPEAAPSTISPHDLNVPEEPAGKAPGSAVGTVPVGPAHLTGEPAREKAAKVVTPNPVIATAPVNTGAAPSAAVPAARQSAAARPVPSGPRGHLVLVASQDSWADIRDAQQNKLLYETVHAGRTVTLEGLAPISVFLGNVDGVKLEYDGKPFDPTPYKRGVVARFTLGESPEQGNVQR